MHIVASQSFMGNVLLSDVHLYSLFVSSVKKTLDYTALLGPPPKVQPIIC